MATLDDAIAAFGAAAKATLDNPAITGEPEDQLRTPLVTLVKAISGLTGLSAHNTELVGETKLSDLMIRPDFAVTRKGALIGFIEVKAPGKGADPNRFGAKSHDRAQWEKLKALPNLIYTDGNAFSLWRDGKRVGDIVYLQGDVRSAGAALKAPAELLTLFTTFYQWDPIPPRSPKQLAEITARICRLLRDEVVEQLDRKAPGLTSLKDDWRNLLFPHATDAEFADGYAQAVTFGLLMAKARKISLKDGIDDAAKELRKSNTLIGSALRLLTEEMDDQHTLDTSLKTLTAVLEVVDWDKLSKGEPEAWLYFYELFLQQYDTNLRKKTGSYYTPPEIVTAMVRLVDEALRSPKRFNLGRGLASSEVTVADPAVGTGTFLLGVLRNIAATVEGEEGAGSVPAAITEALKRLVGFELQFGPFAVAQLRLLAELIDLVTFGKGDDASEELHKVLSGTLRLYITDTLADPDEEFGWIPSSMSGIAESRREANRIKRHEAITVVIGNPPYKEKAKGLGGWVEDRGKHLNAPLDDWQPPVSWGVGAHAKHLRNLYIYFWRWAAWKVFGGDPFRSGTDQTAIDDWTKRKGVICFITVAGFLNGPGFQKMRADLRRDADEIWVIDCTPEGHQPPQASRVFGGVQQPVCIVMVSRKADVDRDTPARVRFRALPEGSKEHKFAAIAGMGLDDSGWVDAPSDWRAPFLPAGAADWVSYPALEDLFLYNGSGVMTGRTWVIAPDAQSLKDRWTRLVNETDPLAKEKLFHPHLRNGKPGDKHVAKPVKEGLSGHEARTQPVSLDRGPVVEPVRYAFRSFDRQWIVPDARLINQSNPTLWGASSSSQVYFTALMAHSPTHGPALTISGPIPDLHHYKGSFGGRVFPLWSDPEATRPNIAPRLLVELGAAYGREVAAPEVMAYIAAVAAHPGYTARFAKHLKQPGLRIPLTAEVALFDEAVAIGREVVWLHTFGERFAEGRPPGPPRVTDGPEPTIPADGALPKTLDAMPHELEYDAAERRLKIGTGYIAHVAPEVWAYEVSGKRVLSQWWSYRRKDRSKPPMGDKRPPSELSNIQPNVWLPEYTTELLSVLRVLTRLVALEPAQLNLLDRIVSRPNLEADRLRAAGGLSNGSADADPTGTDDEDIADDGA
ncbi:type ISP restriction/modification enzyme [Caulobacter sp. CCH9-E1]|uniref:type ISP restriction/modification enzyme n=1 Tax=Caulobacter sp. CCH9-E1 TaxID=1768768 RepID=UPI000AE30DFC|nr:type ISP restriction/modification enzyme [Caulobacter sp. CCH9-E1]